MQNIYLPTLEKLKTSNDAGERSDLVEVYCQVLEHKWYLSERARRDVGHQAAVEDFVKNAQGDERGE
jgi:hypothetical protein